MERQTAVIFEAIFGVLCALFAILWIFFRVIPLLFLLVSDFGAFLFAVLWNIYFFLFLLFVIPTSIFKNIKENIDMHAIQTRPVIMGPPQQQQQQQVIAVNVPSTYMVSPPPQPQPQYPFPSERPTSSGVDVIFCIHCGSKNAKYAKFCRGCGAAIE